MKGSANFSSFAAGKFALRALAQSLAREFGPKGVHVSHVIVDGVIDIPRTKAWQFEHEDAKLDPDAVGYYQRSWLEVPSGKTTDPTVFFYLDRRLILASAYATPHDLWIRARSETVCGEVVVGLLFIGNGGLLMTNCFRDY